MDSLTAAAEELRVIAEEPNRVQVPLISAASPSSQAAPSQKNHQSHDEKRHSLRYDTAGTGSRPHGGCLKLSERPPRGDERDTNDREDHDCRPDHHALRLAET